MNVRTPDYGAYDDQACIDQDQNATGHLGRFADWRKRRIQTQHSGHAPREFGTGCEHHCIGYWQRTHYAVNIPIPLDAISDGMQTLLIIDADSETKLGSIALMAGEALGDDLLVEVELLRAELDMLKRAFRRHCLETS